METDFRVIPDFEAYEINRAGVVRRRLPGQGARVGHVITHINGTVRLATKSARNGTCPNVDMLVARAFDVGVATQGGDLAGEVWRTVVSYKESPAVDYTGRYEVSSMGRVRRVGFSSGARVGRILKGGIQRRQDAKRRRTGKLERIVSLPRPGDSNLPITFRVNRLVATAFLGMPEPGWQANHKNGDPLDDRVENIEWSTAKENVRHARRTGLIRRQHNVRLTEAQVRVIKSLRGVRVAREVAADFGVSKSAITLIWCGRNWKHVE